MATPTSSGDFRGQCSIVDNSTKSTTTEIFTQHAFERSPCLCPDYVWLCAPCGHQLRAADTSYARGWTWRSKYAHLLGGLGTGIAEGNKGVECGRQASCLAVRLIEQEEECDADALAQIESEAEGSGRSWSSAGFAAQEMEGVGGVVKMKVKRMVRVGAEVDEFDDGEEGPSLDREIKGAVRSFCGWCNRVIPAKHEAWDEHWNLGGYA
jgi:hypothetical protein